MGREYELKFAAEPRQQIAVEAAYGPFSVMEMETTYYDTPSGALSARRITLRRRLEGGVSVCTVKTPASGSGRGEWELPWADIHTAVQELCKLGCPAELETLTREGLFPVCGARFVRKYKRLPVENGWVELALDRGVLLGGGRELPLCEVEVEHKEGPEASADAFARNLAETYGLVPEGRSKFQRALELSGCEK